MTQDRLSGFDDQPRVSWDNYVVPVGPRLGVRGWFRWTWRQVTSMRVAMILLLFVALAAVPGSLLPQHPQDPVAARAFVENNPVWGPVANSLGLLDVFGSAWFTAIYVLLFASLIGCIVPRAVAHGRTLRAPIAPAPRTLARYEPEQVQVADAATTLEDARTWLRPRPGWLGAVRGYRVRVDDVGSGWALAADRGHIREIGNVVFHVALVAILVCVALGAALTYRGQALIVEGRTFTNALVAYDAFESGRFFDPETLDPFTLRLDNFDAQFRLDGNPLSFLAEVTLTEPGRQARHTTIAVNSPLAVDGGKIYLQGNGYAPDLTVVDADGLVAFSGPVPFLPQDAGYTSEGVVKIPDVSSGPQVGIRATLFPTAYVDGDQLFSIHPQATNPMLLVRAYTGDLGLDDGVPQNVYVLDESQLSPVRDEAGEVWSVLMVPGETVTLPGDLGTVTWNGLPRFGAFDLRKDPTLPWLLGSAVVCLGALGLSLFGSRRRLWLVADQAQGTTVVTGAVRGLAHDERAHDDLRELLDALAAKE